MKLERLIAGPVPPVVSELPPLAAAHGLQTRNPPGPQDRDARDRAVRDRRPFRHEGQWVNPVFDPAQHAWGFWLGPIWIPLI